MLFLIYYLYIFSIYKEKIEWNTFHSIFSMYIEISNHFMLYVLLNMIFRTDWVCQPLVRDLQRRGLGATVSMVCDRESPRHHPVLPLWVQALEQHLPVPVTHIPHPSVL